MAGTTNADLAFSRPHFEVVNRQKILVFFDFAYSVFEATDTFFKEMSRLQRAISEEGKVFIPTAGVEVDLKSAGGLLAVQTYTQNLESGRAAQAGLGQLGLRIENKLLQLQQAS